MKLLKKNKRNTQHTKLKTAQKNSGTSSWHDDVSVPKENLIMIPVIPKRGCLWFMLLAYTVDEKKSLKQTALKDSSLTTFKKIPATSLFHRS